MPESDRRKYPRINYPCQLTMWMADGANETILAKAANIGLGGLCVHIDQWITLGTKVDVVLTFSDRTPSFSCSGVVVRSQKESGEFYNIGIQFEDLSASKRAFLDGKIAEFIELEQKGKS